MTTFIGTGRNDVANAALGKLSGFKGGTLAQLQDGLGDGIWGFEGDDYIFAGNGSDDIEGWDGHDIINGGAGHDRIWAMQISNVEGSYIGDEITGNDGNDRIYGSAGGDSIDGSADNDWLFGGGGDDLVQGGIGQDLIYGGDGNDTLYATDLSRAGEAPGHSNHLEGDAGDDGITGAEYDDSITGGAGRDVLLGGGGDDDFFFRDGDLQPGEYVDGGGNGQYGDEILLFAAAPVHDFRQVTVTGIERLYISFDSVSTNEVRAIFGADQIKALPGLDLGSSNPPSTLEIQMGGESSLGLAGLDLLSSWQGGRGDHVEVIGDGDAETVVGTGGVDFLFGNAGNDHLDGGGGGDRLTGGIGLDALSGGSGADTFVYTARGDSTVASTGRDVIRDFSRAQADRIDLHLIDANTAVAGNQAFTFIGAGAFTQQAGELQARAVGANTLVSGDVSGNGVADFAILLQGNITLQQGDLIL